MSSALIALEAQVRDDLAKTSHPNATWLEPVPGPDGKPALDVLIVGAGQSGVTTAFGLMRSQVTNILTLDKVEAGQEGPWLSYARMHYAAQSETFHRARSRYSLSDLSIVARSPLRQRALAKSDADSPHFVGGISALVPTHGRRERT